MSQPASRKIPIKCCNGAIAHFKKHNVDHFKCLRKIVNTAFVFIIKEVYSSHQLNYIPAD